MFTENMILKQKNILWKVQIFSAQPQNLLSARWDYSSFI